MKALSLHQPWANWIADGSKTIETRTWSTRYRGRLLICATKSVSHDRPWQVSRADVEAMPRGVSIAVATLADVRPMVVDDERAARCAWYRGALAWVLRDVRPVRAVSIRGYPSLFEIPREVWKALPELHAGAAWCSRCGVFLEGRKVIEWVPGGPGPRCDTCDPDGMGARFRREIAAAKARGRAVRAPNLVRRQ